MSDEVSSTRRLVSASALMASGTLVSRGLGVVRVMLVAFIIGTRSRQADVYELATSLPNMLYILFAGGVLNTVLVPQIVRAIKQDEDGGEAYINRIITAFLLMLGVVTALMTLGTPAVTWIYAPDAWRAPELAEHYQTMLILAALCMPQLFLYGMFFLFAQVLNARDKFGPMMWAPVVNNVISIMVLGLYLAVWGSHADHSKPFTLAQLLVLGVGSTLGIAVQAAVLVPFMRKVGFRYRPRLDLRGTGLGHTFSLTKWTVGFVVVNQLMVALVNRLALSATAGDLGGAGLAVYSRAHMLWILPHSLITVSLATAMLPSASRLAAAGDLPGVAKECLKTSRLATVVLVPASAGFIALAGPLMGLLFAHGASSDSRSALAWTLAAMSLGLVPFTIQYVYLRTYYSMEDTRTPFLLELAISVANAALAILLVAIVRGNDWVAPGLALAYSVAAWFGVAISHKALRGKLPQLAASGLGAHATKLVAAAAVGAIPAYLVSSLVSDRVSGALGEVAAVSAGMVVLALGFFPAAQALKVAEFRDIISLLRTRGAQAAERPQISADPQDDLDDITQLIPVIRDLPPPLEPSGHPGAAPPSVDGFAPIPPAPEAPPEPPERIVEPGQVLGGRYRLEDKVLRRVDTEAWRAFDQVLGRLVLVQVLPAGSPRIERVLSAAKRGAAATDSRFLRVLDAVEVSAPDPVGAFVVSEWAPGETLAEMLAQGPLGAVEAAWIVRELADAMVGMHAQGLAHERLNLDTTIVSASGNVRIQGFSVEAALTDDEDRRPQHERERDDVLALGRMLYAALVRCWPGSSDWRISPAPTNERGELLAPRQVRAGVPPALDAICVDILDCGGGGGPRLTTASDVMVALSKVLGAADPTDDLAHRLRYPPKPVAEPPVGHFALESEEETTQPIRVVADEEGQFAPNRPLTIMPPRRTVPPQPPPPRRRWLWALVLLVVTTLAVSLAWVAVDAANRQRAEEQQQLRPQTSPTAEAPDQPEFWQIVGGADFDPPSGGGDGNENPKLVPKAFDGDPETSWNSSGYTTSDFGNLKPGVGLVLDLGERRGVSGVDITLTGEPTGVQVLVAPPEATSAPMEALSDWREAAASREVGAKGEIRFSETVETRFVLVFFDSAPKQNSSRHGHKVIVNEIAVRS